MKQGWYDGISNSDYHNDDSVSKSGLDLIAIDPASYLWRKDAPVDTEKLKALDYGTDFHAYCLEPELFKKKYKVLPVFNRRKDAEKKAEIELMDEWKESGIIPVKSEDMVKLEMMRGSLMAHPTARAIMDMKGVSERSFFWEDDETGIKCRCRPDKIIELPDNHGFRFIESEATHLVVDLKSTGDINKIEKSIEEFRYFVQDPFYSLGVETVIEFSKVDFLFVFVSTTIDCGRYPVRVVRLSATAKFDGKEEYRKNLNSLSSMKKPNDWLSVLEIDRPQWAVKQREEFL